MVNAWMWWTKKSAVPSAIGMAATFPPTATTSPPQTGVVGESAFGAVSWGAARCTFWIHCANTGCNWMAVSENMSCGLPKALIVSLWM